MLWPGLGGLGFGVWGLGFRGLGFSAWPDPTNCSAAMEIDTVQLEVRVEGQVAAGASVTQPRFQNTKPYDPEPPALFRSRS